MDTSTMSFRVYIKGIDSLDIQWKNRIQKYGSITDIYFPKDDQGNSKYFGFVTISTTSDELNKCNSFYNQIRMLNEF